MQRFAVLTAAIFQAAAVWAQAPSGPAPFAFAVIGDTGTGGRGQYEVGKRLLDVRKSIPFQSVLMLGDNIYGSQGPKDLRTKFELPYSGLIDDGVKFYAVLGNHDSTGQRSYPLFNMGGRSYYTFRPHPDVQFFGIDSNRVDDAQLAWIEKELARSGCAWKIVFFHHPLYSSGARHGSSIALRAALEPLFVKYGVAVALAGHDHFYERIKPQQGVQYFVVGGSSKLRSGVRAVGLTEKVYTSDYSFVVMEIENGTLRYRALNRAGQTIDEGAVRRPERPAPIALTPLPE
ncbi:MAG TPA: metallophosphoesterase [Bryobacteraceae bacterium]|jgi:hypothetical protein